MKKIVLFVFVIVSIFGVSNVLLADDWRIEHISNLSASNDREKKIEIRDLKYDVVFVERVRRFKIGQLKDHFLVKSEESLIWKKFGVNDANSPHIADLVKHMQEVRAQYKYIIAKKK
jgi:hypothetical protein